MSMVKKKVTIGLPVYNGEKFIANTLEALLGQSYGKFELIISDNASTDKTEQICREFASRDSRIRYVRQPKNLGAVPNFNCVFEISDSHYFKWAAADDICDPTYLEKAVLILDTHPEVVWCHSRSSHIDVNGQLLDDLECLDVSYSDREAATASQRFQAVLLGKNGCLDSYGLIRSEDIRKTPLYLPYYGPEKVFIAELALLGSYKEIPETLFFARVIAEGSGNLQTAGEQQAFIDTQNNEPASLIRLQFLFGYFRAIQRSAPSWSERAKCRFVVLKWVLQISKWRRVLLTAIRGQGVGGGTSSDLITSTCEAARSLNLRNYW